MSDNITIQFVWSLGTKIMDQSSVGWGFVNPFSMQSPKPFWHYSFMEPTCGLSMPPGISSFWVLKPTDSSQTKAAPPTNHLQRGCRRCRFHEAPEARLEVLIHMYSLFPKSWGYPKIIQNLCLSTGFPNGLGYQCLANVIRGPQHYAQNCRTPWRPGCARHERVNKCMCVCMYNIYIYYIILYYILYIYIILYALYILYFKCIIYIIFYMYYIYSVYTCLTNLGLS